jgi:hypothetical protein
MRRARVLIHLILVAAIAVAANAAIEEDEIFRSAGGRSCFRDILKRSGFGMTGPFERAAFVIQHSDGTYSCEAWPLAHKYLSEQFYGFLPEHTVAIAHTHPVQFPRPSLQDQMEAVRLGIPIYTITIRGVYKATPGKRSVATIANSQSWIRDTPIKTVSANVTPSP